MEHLEFEVEIMTHYHLQCRRCKAVKYVGSNSMLNEFDQEEVKRNEYICRECSDKEAKKRVN